MAGRMLGKMVRSLLDSPMTLFMFMREGMPQGDMLELHKKYQSQCGFDHHDKIRKNLEVLMFLHDLDRDDLSQISDMSIERINYLTNGSNQKPEGELNIDVPDFIWLGVMLTINTGYDFEKIFEEDFEKMLREHGLCGPAKQSAS